MNINLGDIDQVPEGQGRCFIVNGEEIAVFRTRSGRLFAVENQCPHRRGPLAEGVIGEGKVLCPLHGHKFDLASGRGNEPLECVAVFKVWQKNGQMLVEK